MQSIKHKINLFIILSSISIIAIQMMLTLGDAQDMNSSAIEVVPIAIEVDDFTFEGRAAGPTDGDLVLLLHGFPQSSIEWRAQLLALGEAGYYVVAPDQRGYSPKARPLELENYAYDLLMGDILAIADQLGADTFHLVGHDWGAVIAWGVAARVPERVVTLSTFSIPHPDAFNAQLRDITSCQYAASDYFDFLVSPNAEQVLLADNAAVLRGLYRGLDSDLIEAYIKQLDDESTLRAALNWYSANLTGRQFSLPAIGQVTVPTMYVRSTGDEAVCKEGADATADFVNAPYRYEILDGIGHWIPEEAPDIVTQLILEHLATQR